MIKIKELEDTIQSNGNGKGTEVEKIATNLRRAERDREEYEQKVKELKKVIETNQSQFTNQLKNINAKNDKIIQELVKTPFSFIKL